MNRLVIIGNGFDLAHGLPTGYCDFIDDFWKNFKEKAKTDEYMKFVHTHDGYDKYYNAYGAINCFEDLKNSIRADVVEYSERVFDEHQITYYTSKFGDREKIFEFKNDFFKKINVKRIENWVDIENEYYKLLKNCLKQGNSIVELNEQFEEVKLFLEKYLIRNVEEKFKFSLDVTEEIIKIFENNNYESQSLKRFYLELPKKDEREFEKFFNQTLNDMHLFDRPNYVPSIKINNYFLSFNYTYTAFEYNNVLANNQENLIEIHGTLLDKNNPINFGFGDEMDKHYQEIEEKEDNEYLKNIKSFQYLHTSNYKRLLDLIDSEHFQVYIMGHSCGLSDRTLLNTIFEHENCRSIKIFFHEIKDDKGNVLRDNYTEITQNISRHFNKKKLMREKIVNKTLCQPLPQIQLPKKEKRVNF